MFTPYLSGFESPATVHTFRTQLRIAFAVLDCESLDGLTLVSLATFRATVLKRPGAPGSHALTIGVLRSFLKWAYLMDLTALEPVRVGAVLKSLKGLVLTPYPTFTELEIGALFAAARSRRDRAILALLIGAGLRAAELCALTVEDVLRDSAGPVIHIRHGKGAKDRLVPIREDTLAALDSYVGCRTGPLILSADRRNANGSALPLTPGGLRCILTELGRRAGITKRLSPHGLRHAYASRALRAGAHVVHIKALLGHSSLLTTQRYLDRVSIDEMRGIVPALREISA
jgi:integrase/recombinase XerD